MLVLAFITQKAVITIDHTPTIMGGATIHIHYFDTCINEMAPRTPLSLPFLYTIPKLTILPTLRSRPELHIHSSLPFIHLFYYSQIAQKM